MADAWLTVPLSLLVVGLTLAATVLGVPAVSRRSVVAAALGGAVLWALAGCGALLSGDTADPASLAVLVAAGTAISALAAVPLSASGAALPRVAPAAALWSLIVAAPIAAGLFSARAPFLLNGQLGGIQLLDYGGGLVLWLPVGVLAVAVHALTRTSPDRIRTARRGALVLGLAWAAAVAWLVAVELRLDEDTPRILAGAVVIPVAGAVGWLAVQRIARARSSWQAALAGLGAGIVAAFPAVPYLEPGWWAVLGVLAGACGSAAVDIGVRRIRVVAGATVASTAAAVLFLGVLASDRGFAYVGGFDALGSQFVGLALVTLWSTLATTPFVVVALHRRHAVVRRELRRRDRRRASRPAPKPEQRVRSR